MSCSCNCTCLGSWEAPALSLPIQNILFRGNNTMHCSQCSPPRHRLVCNLPEVTRDRRSIGMQYESDYANGYASPTDPDRIALIAFAIIMYTFAIIICTLVISRRLKRT